MIGGVTLLVAFFALLVWGMFVRPGAGRPGGVAVFSKTGEAKTPLQGRPAPDFSMTLFSGQELTLTSLKGQWVLLDFWASWCVPCRAEARDLEAVSREYRGRFTFVGVNVWDKDGSARDFLQQFGVTYPVGRDPKGMIAVDYGVTGIPEKYFIDPNGRIIRKFVGPLNRERLTGVLEQLLSSGNTGT